MEDRGPQWLSCFPDSCTSLISLNFACLKGEVNPATLERLVARCPNLQTIRLNRSVTVESLAKIVERAPQLRDLGTGSFAVDLRSEACHKLMNALRKCKSIRSLSGFWDARSQCRTVIYPICANLTGLNLSYGPLIQCSELTFLIRHCWKLRRLWVRLDFL